MANIDKAETGLSESSKDGPETANALTSGDLRCDNSVQSPVGSSEQVHPVKSPISSHSTTPDVSATTSHPTPTTGPSATFSAFSIPHPKKFSAVNINKKFLQKNSSSSATVSAASSHISGIKSGSPAPRPAPQPLGSHSRLVTAKLTSTAQLSTTTGPGWSRPSSATPPVAATPSSSLNAPPPQPLAPAPAAPQLPHVGKVIQPQPRNAAASSSSIANKDSSSAKHAWGNANPTALLSFTDNAARNDFPTAAEVAHARTTKPEEPKAEDPISSKQVAPQEADAFRGVHLDPNAHHWDEMEEDDDNFLDNVIEFGDGRQYKIAPTDAVQAAPGAAPALQVDGGEASTETADIVSTEPVSKEDRFADDFDRSWPRSKQSPTVLQTDFASRSSRQASMSPRSSQPSHSPMEGPRVLFNERSNRLEPYSSSNLPNRYGSGPGLSRRGAHAEPSLSPAESRFSRDIAPHSPAHPVQLLQKSSESSHESSMHPPRGHSSGFMGRRQAEQDGGSHPPFGSHFGQNRARGRDASGPLGSFGDNRGPGERQYRRPSGTPFASGPLPNGGPPGLPFDDSRASGERQYRRLSNAHAPFASSPLQPLSAISAEMSTVNNTAANPTHSPVLSHASVTSEVPPSGTSGLDIEGVHKTAMHLSAERAKQRRQLEEEEREQEKERARKKAAELEERMKQAEASKKQAQEAAAIEIIQDAVSSAQVAASPASKVSEPTTSPAIRPHTIERPTSLRPSARPPRDFKATRLAPTASDEPAPPSDQADSWRSKTRLPVQKPQPPSQPAVPAPPPPMLHASDEPIGLVADESLEVVDFSDLGKFVGVEKPSPTAPSPSPSHPPPQDDHHSLPARPVASDFFEDVPPRRAPVNVWETKATNVSSADRTAVSEVRTPTCVQRSQIPAPLTSPIMPQEMRAETSRRFSGANGPVPPTFGNGPLSPTASQHRLGKPPAPFREAPMSALDDVISRIKGALSNMQTDAVKEAGAEAPSNEPAEGRSGVSKSKATPLETSTSTRSLPREARWLPPALRPRLPPQDPDQEVFDVTGCEPPRSPRLDGLIVKFPAISRPVEAIPKRQSHFLKNSSVHVRFEILSWDPPVDGMSRRDLSVNDILFKKPPPVKGKLRYRVQLPRTPRFNSASGPKVNLPSKPNTAPSRSKSAVDELPTWRRGPSSSSVAQKPAQSEETTPVLDVTSCSPPPDLLGVPSKPTAVEGVSSKVEVLQVRPRTQPKMPAGSAVGFYRNPGSSSQESKSAVNFTVISELEEAARVSQPEPSMLLSSSTASPSPARDLSELKDSPIGSRVVDEVSEDKSPSLVLITQVDSKSSEESAERSLLTPASASFSTPWTKSPLSFSNKDSPARGPDPEHLKAVWSQAADKEPVPAVNSLEGIADDLTALPFTIQEVKSEDGETPPPTSSAVSSKISLHDVTRAFQQVPPSSNTPSHRPPPLSPSSASGPITRPSGFNYPSPLQPPGVPMRPHYPAFSSPMLAHSPSPTLLYPPAAPSPVPRMPMNGHSQVYGQHMWMPMQTSQNHNGAVRPVPSPYPTQMMAYPATNAVPPGYGVPHSHQPVPTSVNGSALPRQRGMALISPIMHSATPANVPMYGGSPVLMHPPPMMAPSSRPPYMNSAPARGQGRPDGVAATPHMQQPPHPQNHIPHQPMYSHVPFGRPSW
ncbi:hypothetical protein HYDPIDRAFT_24910 [Hydnomerulius pinastri MD-312]|nr:hypothetical protein HYDPIDRAFT_24910 [Hydnomerulius pinastri MD-312]